MATSVNVFPLGRSILILVNKGLVILYIGKPGVTGKKPIAEKTTNADIEPPSSSPGTPKILS